MKKNLPERTIVRLYKSIRKIIEESRDTVYRTSNFAMVQAYWHIGKLIVEDEQSGKERAEYGTAFIMKEC